VTPDQINHFLQSKGGDPITEAQSLGQLLRRSEVELRPLLKFAGVASEGRTGVLFEDERTCERIQIERPSMKAT
jgi:hypothetical protein